MRESIVRCDVCHDDITNRTSTGYSEQVTFVFHGKKRVVQVGIAPAPDPNFDNDICTKCLREHLTVHLTLTTSK